MQPKRIVIAGGGTGGHIFPAVAVARALKRIDSGVQILFIGAKGKMEMEKVPAAGFEIEGLDIAGFDRGNLFKNISLPYKLIKSFLQVKSIFGRFKPDAAFGVGGYSSFPVLRYAQRSGLKTYLHEANAHGGKSNQMLSRRATRIFAGTGGMDKFFPADKIVFSGNPVRHEIMQPGCSKREALDFFGLHHGPVTLLVIGGSLGARSINLAVQQGISRWLDAGHQLIWQTGTQFSDEAQKAVQHRKGVFTSTFIADMSKAYLAADLVISRAGAMSVAELCITAKPAIFVPYPFAAENHQYANAMNLVSKDAAMLVKDEDASANLIDSALLLAADPEMRANFSMAIKPLATIDADMVIASTILNDLSEV